MNSEHYVERGLWQKAWWPVLLISVLLLPLILFFVFPAHGAAAMPVVLLLLLLLFNLLLMWLVLRKRGGVESGPPPLPPRILTNDEVPPAIQQIMEVQSAREEDGWREFRGPLRESPEKVFEDLKQVCGNAWVPLVQEDAKTGAAIFLVPKPAEEVAVEKASRLWVHWMLFALTLLTTTWAGALQQGINLLRTPEQFAVGLPYSIGLLAILGCHELGHYFTARHYKMRVTPPFFIPVPFALGTFGAFIQMRSPAENRRSLFDVAVAGPLAGLVLAIPALIIGLQSSTVIPIASAAGDPFLDGSTITSSILFVLIAKLALGAQLAGGNQLLQLSPLAFAGWLGLLVTALNLLPIGQLDGGHMARAMFGSRVGGRISRVAMWSLFLLALFVWPNLLIWAVIVFFIARRAMPPLNDLTPISAGRRWLGAFSFVILLLILIPMPQGLW